MRAKDMAGWLVAVAACLAASAASADLALVENGVAKATIVIARSAIGAPTEPTVATFWSAQPATNKIAAAARDLQLTIEKMSGARLPVVGDDQAPQGLVILVGRSALTKDFDARIPSGLTPVRDEEGYVMIAKGDRLLLAGNDEGPYHGSEYAVGAFLHRLGVRWYMPGDFGEFIPRQATVKTAGLNVASRPDFKMRNWWGPQMPDQCLLEYRWKIRNGMNPMLHFVTLPADSSIRSVLPPAGELTNTNLADVWGRREDGKPNDGMPNLTSEKSVAYAAEKIKDYFRKNPSATSYGLGGDDGYPRDYSPGTLKRNLGMPDVGGRLGVASDMSTTEEWMEWVQAVAREVYINPPKKM